MVGITAANSRESVASILDSLSFASEIPSKLELLRQLRAELSRSDTVLLSEFLSHLLKLLSDQFSPVRKLVIEVIGDVGSNSLELLPEIIPRLMPVVDDDTPAVARQAINTATELFKFTLQKVGIQGLHSSELDDSLESAWACMMKLKEKLYSVAFQRGSDGRKLIALKFVVAVILLYTPDPSGSAEPPAGQNNEEKVSEFNMSWVRRGHPLLKVGDLSVEASQSSGLLLDQLRYPTVKSLGVSSIIVLINCVSAVAKKRPSFYGRILPALLGLDPSNLATEGVHLYALQHALKKAFISCLECTHSSSTPWRDRLVGALRELKAEGYSDQVVEVNTVNGKVDNGDRSTPVPKEEPALTDEIFNELNMMKGRKRSGDQELGETSEGGDTPGKRLRSASADSEVSPQQLKNAIIGEESTTQKPTSFSEVDFGPVQQLVGVFAALVAQGDKAAASLEILISSISADLLAEVVMCNMRNLSDHCPKLKDSESPDNIASHTSMPERDSQFRQLSVFIENMFSSCGSAKVGSEMDVDPPTYKVEMGHVEESPSVAEHENYAMVSATDGGAGEKITPPSSPCASGAGSYVQVSKGYSAPTTVFQDVNEDSGIPGLDGVPSDGYKDAMTSSSLVSTDVDETSQDQAISVGKRIQVDSLPSLSAERSDESGLRAVATEVSSGMKSTATSLASTYQLVLPKMAAPFVDLTDEEKDEIQKASFTRIVEAYKQVSTAGGTELQFSLLAYLAVKFPSDLDPWILVQKQVLSDYVNNEGHELTLRVLYKLYGEAEEEHDFFSSTTATSVYEMFLLKVAETLHDSLPPSDKSLSRLLAEVPYLPKTICEFLGRLCCPESTDADDKESQSGDRVTQGLSTVWSLILSRPPHRDVLLQIALQSAVHHLDEVRMKAIRLVANKLYPVASIAHQIEEFAKQRLLSVTNITDADAENCNLQSQKSCDTTSSSTEQLSHDAMTKNQSSNAHQSSMSENVSNTLIASARRSMSLYFALCTKKHSLLRQIFIIYESSPLHVKQAIHSQMPMLVRTVGTSPMLLEIISNPPEGSLDILMKVMHTLTDGMHPSPELINTIKKLYELKGKDIEILFPILSFLPKDEVISAFNRLFHLSPQKFQGALNRVLQGSASSAPVLTPEEVLIAIHGIDPEKEKVPLKKVTDACNACFEQRQIFTQQVIAKVLNQLVEQTPLPLLFMRTVLQAIGAFPALVDFIMGILSRLVNKQIWKYPKLWVGFLKCAQLTQPHSFSILLQLPPSQLEGALNKIPALRTPLTSHASQPDVKSTLPRSILVVLGLATDSQPTNQEQAAATPAEDSAHAKGSENDAISEKLKESPSVG